jgi:hypothetical protein
MTLSSIVVCALAVCIAPAANKEQTQIASAQIAFAIYFRKVFELCASEMCHVRDENIPLFGQ